MSHNDPLGRPLAASVKTEAKGTNSGTEYFIKFHTYEEYEKYKHDLLLLNKIIITTNGNDYMFNVKEPEELGKYGFRVSGTINEFPEIDENTQVIAGIVYSKSMPHKEADDYDKRPI